MHASILKGCSTLKHLSRHFGILAFHKHELSYLPQARQGIQRQCMSSKAEITVYQGPQSPSVSRPVTLTALMKKYSKGEILTCVTAYDYPSAVHVDRAGMDMLLVGDSAAMVVHGHDTTQPIDLDTMILHCKAVCRGARRPFIIGDLPFGSYERSSQQAVDSALRMVKEGGVDAVKLEGGSPARVEAARAIVEAGIAVMGHVGLTPQAISVIGGFRPQGRTASNALGTVKAAKALQEAGCFSIILECIPAVIADSITQSINIPTIGIGAGKHCSGQVLVYHDLLGMMTHPHHALVTPKFVKQFASLGKQADAALEEFKNDVKNKSFPSDEYSPYVIPEDELEQFKKMMDEEG